MDEVYKLPKIAFPEVTGDTVSFFSEYAGLPLKKCEVAFAATQSGTGDPSPDNVRPIVGVDSVSVVDSAADQEYYPVNKLIPIPAFQDGEGDPSPSNVRQILYGLSITRDDDSELEVYGGTLNVFSGKLKVTDILKPVLKEDVTRAAVGDVYFVNNFFYIPNDIASTKSNILKRGANQYATQDAKDNLNDFEFCCTTLAGTPFRLFIKDSIHTTIEDFRDWLDNNPINILVKLATPEVIQLSATELQRAKEALGIVTATIDLDGTRYGGVINTLTGEMSVTWISQSMDVTWVYSSSNNGYFAVSPLTQLPAKKNGINNILCDVYKTANTSTTDMPDLSVKGISNSGSILVRDGSFNGDVTNFINFVKDHYIVYELATPLTIQLTPAQIATIQGTNTIFADTGDTTVQYIRVY